MCHGSVDQTFVTTSLEMLYTSPPLDFFFSDLNILLISAAMIPLPFTSLGGRHS